jgi:TonB family protein
MRFRQYLIASLILHGVLITAAFFVLYRERTCPLPIHFMEVSVVKEFGLDKFFSNSPNDNVKNHSAVGKESQERRVQRASKSFSSSSETTDQNRPSSLKDNENEIEIQELEASSNLRKFSSANEEKGISVVSNIDEGSSLSQDIKKERHSPIAIGEMSAHQGIVLTSLNTLPQDFRGNDFYRAIRTLLERARSYPLLARERGLEGTVFVSFVIGSKGLPQDVKIMKSSGHQILDEEVKKMLKKASPFPGIKGEIVIPITFKLTDSISNRQ